MRNLAILSLITSLLIGGCGLQETSVVSSSVVIEDTTVETIEVETIDEAVIDIDAAKDDIIDYCMTMMHSDSPNLTKVAGRIERYPEIMDEQLDGYNSKLSYLGSELSKIERAYEPYTSYLGLNIRDVINPAYCDMPERESVTFDADSLEMIGVTHKGFLYEADGEDGKVQIASMDLLEEGTVSTLEKCASIGRFVDTIDGVSTDVHVYMYGDEFADRNQTNDFIMYEACLRSSKNVLQDVIDYLEGREPENKSYYSLDEIAAEYDLVYFREENL